MTSDRTCKQKSLQQELEAFSDSENREGFRKFHRRS